MCSSDVSFDQFKKEMLAKFESMESKIEHLKIKTKALTEELRDHKELSRLMTVTESCLELANYGITTSKEYDIDPDGVNRQVLLVHHKNKCHSQCPRTDLSKRFLPKPMTATGWKGTP